MKRWTIGFLIAACCVTADASAEVTQLSVVAVGDASVEITARGGDIVRGHIVGHDSTRFVILTDDGVARELRYRDVERLRVSRVEPVDSTEREQAPDEVPDTGVGAEDAQAGASDSSARSADDAAFVGTDASTPSSDLNGGYFGGGTSTSLAADGARVPGPFSNSLGVPYARGFDPEVVTTLVARGRRQRIWGGVLLGVGSLSMISQVTSMVQREGYGGAVYDDDIAVLVMSSAMMVGGIPLILAGRKKHAAAAAYQREFLMTPTAARGGGGVQLNARF